MIATSGIFATLLNHKSDINENLARCGTLLTDETVSALGKHQFIVDWCVRNTTHLLNKPQLECTIVGKFLDLFEQVLVKHNNEVAIICRPATWELLNQCLSDERIPSKCTVCRILLHLLRDESARKTLLWKPSLLVDFLSNLLNHVCNEISCISAELRGMHYEVSDIMLNIYLRHVGTQCATKKFFSTFCDRLLSPLLHTQSLLLHTPGESICDKLLATIEKVLQDVLCHREHTAGLRQILERIEVEETAAKKKKVDRYYDQMFSVLRLSSDSSSDISPSAASLFRLLVVSFRSVSALNRPQEFSLMQRMLEFLHVDSSNCASDERTSTTLLLFLDTCHTLDIYSRVEDVDAEQSLWLRSALSAVIVKVQDGDQSQCLVLLARRLFSLSHEVVEGRLVEVLGVCLRRGTEDEVWQLQDSLMCDLLSTSEKLSQLSSFVSDLLRVKFPSGLIIPSTFSKQFTESCSRLNMASANEILRVLAADILNDNRDEQTSETSARLEVACYLASLLISNVPVLPVNGYMNDDLEDFIKLIASLKEIFDHREEDIIEPIITRSHLLLENAVMNVSLVLCYHGLMSTQNSPFTVRTQTSDSNRILPLQHPRNFYLKVCNQIGRLKLRALSDGCDEKIHSCGDLFDMKYIAQDCLQLWDQQYFTLSPANVGCAHLFILSRNLPLVVSCGEDAVRQFVGVVWNNLPLLDGIGLSSIPLALYNSPVFQTELLNTIATQFSTFFPSADQLSFLTDAFEDVDRLREITRTCCSELTEAHTDARDNDLQTFLQNLELLQFDCLEEHHLFQICCMVLRIRSYVACGTEKPSTSSVFKLLDHILHVVLTGNMTTLARSFPIAHVFDDLCSQKHINATVMNSVTIKISKILAKFHGKEDKDITEVLNKIGNTLTSNQQQHSTVLPTVAVMLRSFTELLSEPTVPRKVITTVTTIANRVAKDLTTVVVEHEDVELFDSFLECFTHICSVVQQLQKDQDKIPDTLTLDDMKLNLHTTYDKILPNLKSSHALSPVHIRFLCLLYSYRQSDSLCADLLRLYETTDQVTLLKLLTLLRSANLSTSTEEMKTLICSITSSSDHVQGILDMLFSAMCESSPSASQHATFLDIWTALLRERWEKEKKKLLWTNTLQVIFHCLHCINNGTCSTTDHLISICNLFVSVTNSFTHPSASQHLVGLLNIFPVLARNNLEKRFDRVPDVLLLKTKLLSQLLFHHSSAIYPAISTFITAVNCLLFDIVAYNEHLATTNSIETEMSKLKSICESFSRLYTEISTHKSIITKYSPYLISNFVRASLQTSFPINIKHVMTSGLYHVMDTCTDFEFSLLAVTLDANERDHMMQYRQDYTKHHKYTGKA